MSFNAVYVTNNFKNIQKIEVAKNLTLDGTNAQLLNLNTKKFKKIYIYVQSSLDVELDFRIRGLGTVNQKMWNGSSWVLDDTVIIPANDSSVFFINTALPYLNELVTDNLGIRVQAKNTASKGNITITIMGVLN